MYIEKLQSSQNNPEKSYTEKKARHDPSGLSMFTRCSFDKKKNLIIIEEKIEKLCKKFKESAMEIID